MGEKSARGPAPGPEGRSDRDRGAAPDLRRSGPDAAAPAVSALPLALLGDPRLEGRGNGPARAASLTEVQRAAGNRAARRLLVQRAPPNATMPPPNASVAPAPPQANKTVLHEGVQLTPSEAALRPILEQKVATTGWENAGNWVNRFTRMDNLAKVRYQTLQNIDLAYFTSVQDHLQDAWLHMEHDRTEFLAKFERDALEVARTILDHSKEEIEKELEHYGIKEVLTMKGPKSLGTGYTMGNAGAGAGLQGAARELAAKLRLVRHAMAEASKAREEQSKYPFIVPPGLAEKAKTTHEAANKLQAEYEQLRVAKVKDFPLLATYATGWNSHTQLDALAATPAGQLGETIGTEAHSRLQNIDTVRGELGKRFQVWTQAHVLDVTKKRSNAAPWQSRLVTEKADKVTESKEDTKMMWAAVAIGLGLLAAIPTGGTSVLAGVAAAAAVTGAAVSMYGAYEEIQDYRMAAAANGTSFDKANAISQDAPDLLWLAIDVVGAIADVQAAAAAFKTLRVAMQAAEASKLAKLPDLVRTAGEVGLSSEAKGRLVAAAIGKGGGGPALRTTLEEIAGVFRRAATEGSDRKLMQAFHAAAEKAVAEGKVLVVSGSWKEQKAAVEAFVAKHEKNPESAKRLSWLINSELTVEKSEGLYNPILDVIIVKGDGSAETVASIMAHELAHQRQDLVLGIENMSKFESEFQAFYAQQEFLKNLKSVPGQQMPEDMAWLLNADAKTIEKHVIDNYKGTIRPQRFTPEAAGEEITNMLKHKHK